MSLIILERLTDPVVFIVHCKQIFWS